MEDRVREIAAEAAEAVARRLIDERLNELEEALGSTPISLTRGELAEARKVGTATVDRWRAAGCPCLRAGAIVRFDLVEVDRWLATRRPMRGRPRKSPAG